MMLFKACQRCAGDLRETADVYGRYLQCIQCGHVLDIPTQPIAVVSDAVVTMNDQPAAAA